MRAALFTIAWLAAGSVFAGAPPVLNDTGQGVCYDGNSTELCDPHGYPGQDARYGRDAAAADGALVKTGAGAAGFDFGKIARDGTPLPPEAAPGPNPGDWGCTRDHASGLTWAIETPASNWANATAVTVANANAAQLCGFSDWRLPSSHELHGLVHYGAASPPLIDGDYFPATVANQHWSSDTRVSLTSQAWVVNFNTGRVEFVSKTQSRPVRVVRGAAVPGGLSDNGDGTVTDSRTGIVWDRCSLGQTWDGSACAGTVQTPSWQAALQAVQARNAADYLGHDDWRLPNAKELGSLVDRSRNNPAIDPTFFPNTPTGQPATLAWTSTTHPASFLNKWIADFSGGVVRDHTGGAAAVRLARGGHGDGAYDRLRYSIGGTVTGLAGSELTLRLNGVVDLPLAADGPFVFPSLLADGASYAVIVQEQPAGLTCSVADGTGVVAAANVTDIAVACVAAESFTVTPIVAIGQGSLDPATPQTVDGGHRLTFTVTPEAGWRIAAVAGSCGGVLFGTTYRTDPIVADCAVMASFVEGTAPVQPLNDTAQSFCFNDSDALVACEPATVPGQDGRYGRDPAADADVLPKLGTGVEGFDFTKLAADGSELPAGGAGDWACNRDNVSGLTWTVAAPAATWDAAATVAADANAAQLCGHADWRLPRVQELHGLVHYGLPAGPLIDAGHFPGTTATDYWAGDVRSDDDTSAWSVDFNGGATGTRSKTQSLAVRLVRGTAPGGSFVDNGDGTVTDADTGLMWDRCDMTQTWDGSTCVGSGGGMNWLPALFEVQARNAANHRGYGDWRMPNVKEALTLVELTLRDPAIDTNVFPNIPPFSQLWTSTTVTGTPADVQAINLFDGSVRTLGKTGLNRVRLVRGSAGYDGYDRLLRSIGGTVAGLSAEGLVLQINGGETLPIDGNGPFTFPTRLLVGASYSVTLLAQPPKHVCLLANGSGVVGDSDVTNIGITCGIVGVSWIVTPSVVGNGSIDPPEPQLVDQGDSFSFTLTPDAGWHLAGVAGSCGGVLDGSTYTTGAVTADCTVEATFAANSYTVTGNVAAGSGSVVPPQQTVIHGGSASFAVIAESGYTIQSVSGCGGTLTGTTYVTGPVSGACVVSASFVQPAPSADLAIAIDDGRDHARYGGTLNYLVMAHNTGPSSANDVAIGNDFPPELDADGAQWLCLGGSGVSCTAQGQGPLVDTGVVIPSGAGAAWLLSAPVRGDAGAAVENEVSVASAIDGNAGNNAAGDHTWLVLLRDGFERFGDGASSLPLSDVDRRLDLDSVLSLQLPLEAPAELIDVLLRAEAESRGFRLERLVYGARSWLRLVAFGDAGGERLSAWLPVAAGAEIVLALAEADDGARYILLHDGRGGELSLPIAPAPSYRLQIAEGLGLNDD